MSKAYELVLRLLIELSHAYLEENDDDEKARDILILSEEKLGQIELERAGASHAGAEGKAEDEPRRAGIPLVSHKNIFWR